MSHASATVANGNTHRALPPNIDVNLADLGEPGARVEELVHLLTRRIRERPVASLAVALGVGFLVGGGLSFRFGRMALAIVARRAARGVLKQVL